VLSLTHSRLHVGGSMQMHTKQCTNAAEAVIKLSIDPAGSLRNLMLGSASSVMQQTARLTIVVTRQFAFAL